MASYRVDPDSLVFSSNGSAASSQVTLSVILTADDGRTVDKKFTFSYRVAADVDAFLLEKVKQFNEKVGEFIPISVDANGKVVSPV